MTFIADLDPDEDRYLMDLEDRREEELERARAEAADEARYAAEEVQTPEPGE